VRALITKPDHGANIGVAGDKPVTANNKFQIYLDDIQQRVNRFLLGDSVELASYTVATLPAQKAAGLIYVSDEIGGATLAFSDGTNWRRVQDRVVVS
jgi:hypothetical protein